MALTNKKEGDPVPVESQAGSKVRVDYCTLPLLTYRYIGLANSINKSIV